MRKVLIYTATIGISAALALGLWLPKYQEKARAATAIKAHTEAAKIAEDRIRDKLKDPDSAIFKNTKTFDNGNACGEVNAKNSYGGFQGYTAWWIAGNEAAIHKAEDTDVETACTWAKDPKERARAACYAMKAIIEMNRKYKINDDGKLQAGLIEHDCMRFDEQKSAR